MEDDFCLKKGELRILLPKEVDHHNAEEIRQRADRMLETAYVNRIVFDFSRTEFMDSSGLGLIMGRYELMRELGGDVTVRDPAPCVDRMLRLTGFDRRVKIELSTSGIRTPHGKR